MIIVNALLSWFVDKDHPIREFIAKFVNPVVRPVRKLVDKLPTSSLPIDLSPILTYFIIMILIQLLADAQRYLLDFAMWH